MNCALRTPIPHLILLCGLPGVAQLYGLRTSHTHPACNSTSANLLAAWESSNVNCTPHTSTRGIRCCGASWETACSRRRRSLRRSLHPGHLEGQFRVNGVDGAFLQLLSEQDLVNRLGLLPLQARKVVCSFRALQA